MPTIEEFYGALQTFRPRPDTSQRQTIEAAATEPLFIVAGPGSGKTTCLTLRVLKMVLVDRVPANGILATTFTRKAAQELRSRLLGWGFRIIDALRSNPALPVADRDWLADIDINQVRTGTLDSLCEQLVRDYRAPGVQPPVLADDFVAQTVMLREGILNGRKDQDPHFSAFLQGLHGTAYNFHVGTQTNLARTIWERRHMDLLEWDHYVKQGGPAAAVVKAALDDYRQALQQRGLVDFVRLEYEVLERLRTGALAEFTRDLRAVLVDEYQDTNLLQEQIYFALAQACGGALCVVGDDDQSLYRFRGATVDLFSNFVPRFRQQFDREPLTFFLSVNYRSTFNIVCFVNAHARQDQAYQAVRVNDKPPIVAGPRAAQGMPVLGLFRATREELARDLAGFIWQIFRGDGARTRFGNLVADREKGGDIGDCALLCSTPKDRTAGGQSRLPRLLAEALGAQPVPVRVFNPRGQDFADIGIVQQLGGLLAECVDPGGRIQATMRNLYQEAGTRLTHWRQAACALLDAPQTPAGLSRQVKAWVTRDPGRDGQVWPPSVQVIELLYALVHYLPVLHEDAEGQIYLEVFTRQLKVCEQIGKFRARVLTRPEDPALSDKSVEELLRDFLGPIAAGSVDVDEELIPSFPRDQLSVLSIHQAKGLEFPLTIVDVGSDFRNNHQAHAFKRFPAGGGATQRLEDAFRPFSPLGRPGRGQRDRAVDDLIRQYFVAFSRPQDVLLLVGLDAALPAGNIPNLAAGWDRQGICHWAQKLPFERI